MKSRPYKELILNTAVEACIEICPRTISTHFGCVGEMNTYLLFLFTGNDKRTCEAKRSNGNRPISEVLQTGIMCSIYYLHY